MSMMSCSMSVDGTRRMSRMDADVIHIGFPSSTAQFVGRYSQICLARADPTMQNKQKQYVR